MRKETVNNMIKACIVSRKGGVLLQDIEREYESLVGERIPYIALGHKNLLDYITSIDCVELKRNFVGDQVLSVCDPKIAHIDSLVKKQKNPSNRRPPKKKGSIRKNRSPVPYYKSSRYGKRSPDHRPSRYESRNTAEFGPYKFKNNTRMEYTQSKWYSDRNCFRSKDFWTKEKKESRQINRLDNFNAGRSGMQHYDDDYNENFVRNHSSNDSSKNNSWNSKSTSISNVEVETTYNPVRYRESERNSNWRFRVQVADSGSAMVGKSHTRIDYESNNRRNFQQNMNTPRNHRQHRPGDGPINTPFHRFGGCCPVHCLWWASRHTREQLPWPAELPRPSFDSPFSPYAPTPPPYYPPYYPRNQINFAEDIQL